MHEIEVKARIEGDKEALLARLTELGCAFGPAIRQDDTVFVKETGSVETYLSNPDFLRLRVENGERTLFTFKHHPTRATGRGAAPLEFEVTVDSAETMERILLMMGYREALRIHKTRRKGRYQNWEVCVDEVEGLGDFLELEELAASDDDVDGVCERMRIFLEGLGLRVGEQREERYDILLLRARESSVLI